MNIVSQAKINYNALLDYSPSLANKALRMLNNGVSAKRVRNYLRANVEEAAQKKIIRKKIKTALRADKKDALRTNKVKPKIKLRTQGEKEFRLPEDNVIGAKYKPLLGNHGPVYDPVVYTALFLNHVLLSSVEYRSLNDTSVIKYATTAQHAVIARELYGRMENYLRTGNTFVETRLKVTDERLEVKVGGNAGIMEDAGIYARVLKSLFPQFELPKSFSRTVMDDLSKETRISLALPEYSLADVTTFKGMTTQIAEYSLADLMTKKFNYGHDDTGGVWTGKDQLIFPADMIPSKVLREELKKIIHFKLTLTPDIVATNDRMSDEDLAKDGGKVEELKSAVKLIYNFKVEAYIRWPLELAYYVTSVRDPSDFIPAMFYRLAKWTLGSYSIGGPKRGRQKGSTKGGPKTSSKVPARISHFGVIKKKIEIEKRKRNIKPRVNEDGFAILGSAATPQGLMGAIVHVPANVDKVDEYLEYYKTAHNPNTNEVIFDSSKALLNQPIFTDWYNEKMIVGGAEENAIRGSTQTFDLLGCKPLDNLTIGRDLNANFQLSAPYDWKLFCETLQKGYSTTLEKEIITMDATQSATRVGQVLWKDITDQERATLRAKRINNLDTAMAFVNSNGERDVTWGMIGYMRPANYADNYPTMDACLRMMRNASEYVFANLSTVDTAYSRKASMLLYRLTLICKYSRNFAMYNEVYRKAVDDNSYIETDPAKMNFTLANLPGIKTLLPHQSKVLSSLSKDPQNIILHVRAGGGKTPMSLSKLLDLINKGLAKRVLICMPGQLVRQFAREINEFSEGLVNAFPLTLETVRNMQQLYQDPKNKDINYEALAKIMNEAPPNTIFLSSLTFLSNDNEMIVYGNDVTRRYYTAEFMRDFGFDAICCDESQFIKNASSGRTNAVSVVASGCKYIVPMSGTVIHNTLVDIVGQMSIINSAAVGSKTHFEQKWMNGKTPMAGAPAAVREELKPFAKLMYTPRREWAFALPRIDEQFHPVEMTAAQRAFYSTLLAKAIERIKADEKLMKKLQTATEEESRAIESKLKTYFANVEEFVYAPDSNEAFVNQSNVRPADLVSPKVPYIDQIITDHLNSQPQTPDEKGNPQNKILVFSSRLVTSKHIMKHSKHKAICSHYTAGDVAAIQRFLTDERIRVLVADEGSISFGNNFQLASRLIRAESLWTPGDMDQALARIWRLAFKSGKDRKTINLDHIYTNNSLEVAKIARLMSKTIQTRLFEEAENVHFNTTPLNLPQEAIDLVQEKGVYVANNRPVVDSLQTLPQIVMNLDTIKEYDNADKLPLYFGNYTLLNVWEDKEFERFASDPTMKLWEVPNEKRAIIKGSKKLEYTPRAPGQLPYDPDGRLGLQPISVLEQQAEGDIGDDDDDEGEAKETYVDNAVVKPGDFVDTEFGYGYITRVKDNHIDVSIRGLKEEVTVLKSTAYIIGNKEERLRIKRELRSSPAGMPKLPLGIEFKKGNTAKQYDEELDAASKKNKVAKEEPTPTSRTALTRLPKGSRMLELDNDEGEEDFDSMPKSSKPEKIRGLGGREVDISDDDEMFDLSVDLIDYKIALTVYEADDDTQYLTDRLGFKQFPSFLAIQIKNARQLDRVMDTLVTKFTIDKAYLQSIESYAKRLPGGPEKMRVFDPSQMEIAKRFIRVATFKKVNKGVLRPYPLVWDGQLFLILTIDTHPSAARIPGILSKIPGVTMQEVDTLRMRFFDNAQQAEAFVETIKEKINRPAYRKAISALSGLRKIHRGKVVSPGATQTRIATPAKKPAKPAKPAKPTTKPSSKPAVKKPAAILEALRKLAKRK